MVKHISSAAYTHVDAIVIGAGKARRCCPVCHVCSTEDIKGQCVLFFPGVVGLAIARALALSGREVIVLESESAIGTSTSARNSEVVHSGEASEAPDPLPYA